MLAALFAAGYLLKLIPGFPRNFYQKVNAFIIYGPLPAITLLFIPRLELGREALFPVLSAWYLFALAIPCFYLLKRAFGWSRETFAALVLVCGLGNTSFIGYPVISMLYGADKLSYAILVDQSTFVILSTVGVIWAATFAHGRPSLNMVARRLLRFPPFLAFLVALVLPTDALAPVERPLEILGGLMVPLAIFSIGMQFRFLVRDINYGAFYSGLFFKLVFAPATLFAIMFLLAGRSGVLYEVTLLECAMPPMITAAIIANQYKLEGDLANALVTYGIPAAFATLWGWTLVL